MMGEVLRSQHVKVARCYWLPEAKMFGVLVNRKVLRVVECAPSLPDAKEGLSSGPAVPHAWLSETPVI
jgi:hypothetical protein